MLLSFVGRYNVKYDVYVHLHEQLWGNLKATIFSEYVNLNFIYYIWANFDSRSVTTDIQVPMWQKIDYCLNVVCVTHSIHGG